MNAEPIFTAETRYDEAAYGALVGLMMRLRRWPRRVVLLTGLLSVALSGYAMLKAGEVSAIALLFLFLGNLFAALGILAPRFVVRLLMAGNPKGEIPRNQYAFHEDCLIAVTRAGTRRYGYGELRRVVERGGYLFFFCGDGQAYLLRREDVRGGYAALRDFINARLGAGEGESAHAVGQGD